MGDHLSMAKAHLEEHREALASLEGMLPEVVAIAEILITSLQAGGKVLFFGNGGSAADAQHLSTELVVRYRRERRALASIALTTDTSALTAAANDFGYDCVFERQVAALARPGDVAIGLSTSGTSRSVILGLAAAREAGAIPIGMTGQDGGELPAVSDLCLRAPSPTTAVVQECHILCGHILCDLVEDAFAGS